MDLAFVIAKDLNPDEQVAFQSQYTSRKKSVAIGVLLACPGIFCGIPGLHKFYLGQIGAGMVYLIGALISYALTLVFVGFVGLIVFWILCIIDACNMGSTITSCNDKIARDIKAEIEIMRS